MELPGRIPIFAQLHEHACYRAGLDPAVFYNDAGILVRNQIETSKLYEMDLPMILYDVYNIEAEALGQPVVGYRAKGPQLAGTPLLSNKDDLEQLKLDLGRGRWPGRTRFVTEVNRLIQQELATPPPLFFCAPFTLAVTLRGYTGLITDLKRDPGFGRRLLEHLCRMVVVPWIKLQHEHCPEATLAQGVDAWGSLPNTDLQIWDEFIIPIYEYLRELLTGEIAVGFVGYWGESLCADAWEFIKRKLYVCGPCFWGGIIATDPDLKYLGLETFARIARAYGRKLILGIGAEELYQGPPEAIAARINQYKSLMGPEQPPINLFLAHIIAETPPENIRAAVQAAHH